jgi:hypothetical protein
VLLPVLCVLRCDAAHQRVGWKTQKYKI